MPSTRAAVMAAAATTEEWVAVANERGFAVTIADLPDDGTERELSDAELEGAAGGYTFPPTDWIYCDNPWTCLLYTSDAADDQPCVDPGGPRILKQKTQR